MRFLSEMFRKKNLWDIPEEKSKEKNTREHASPEADSFDFQEWKVHLENAMYYPEFLNVLKKIKDFTDTEAHEYIFADNGLLHRFSNREIKLLYDDYTPLDQEKEDDFYHFENGFYRVLGFKIFEDKSLSDKDLLSFGAKLKCLYNRGRKVPEETSFTEEVWEDFETPLDTYDSHRKWERKNLERENNIHLAQEFFNVCAERNLTEALPDIIEITSYAQIGWLNREAVDTCNSIDPHESARILLEKVKNPQTPEREKNVAGRLLYLLEMGEVNVTAGQLEYLSKKYNLKGEKTKDAVTAIRITPDGKLGLLNKESVLIGYIEFGDFENGQEREAQIMEISNELLSFTKSRGGSATEFEDEKQDFLREYHAEFYQKYVQGKFGIPVNNLELREQFWIFQFLRTHSEDAVVEQIAKYGHLYRENFLKSFIALESSDEMGGIILQLAAQFEADPIVGRQLFDQFAEFTGFIGVKAKEVVQLYQDIFYEKQVDEGSLKKALLDRAGQFLSGVKDELQSGGIKKEEVIKKISQYVRTQFDVQTRTIKELAVVESDVKKLSALSEGQLAGKELERFTSLQRACEKKLDLLVYGKESAVLPRGFIDEVLDENGVENTEKKVGGESLYFPVGISKDLASWEKVLAGEARAAHPIEMYSYLLWLHNQGQRVQLVVCDTVQVFNYDRIYSIGKSEAREKALQIGQHEAAFYRQAIVELGLKNIEVVHYDEVKQESPLDSATKNSSKESYQKAGKSGFEYYTDLCAQFSALPLFQEALAGFVQASATGGSEDIRYGLDEIAFILSTSGAKVSHVNEARYDVLAAFIKELEQRAEAAGIDCMTTLLKMKEDVRGLDETELQTSEVKLAVLFGQVLEDMRDLFNEKKAELQAQGRKKGDSETEYFKSAAEVLKKIRPVKMEKEKVSRADKAAKKKLQGDKPKINFSFVVPAVDSQSFGWRGRAEVNQEVVKFREPYSTYFFSSDTELFATTDQVVGVKEGNIGGKILTLEKKNQEEYARRVLSPLLKEYVKALGTAQPQYFMRVGKTREDIVNEMKECQTLTDALQFIQKYIVTSEITMSPRETEASLAAA